VGGKEWVDEIFLIVCIGVSLDVVPKKSFGCGSFKFTTPTSRKENQNSFFGKVQKHNSK
jgi:hypothetical protein